MSCHLCLFGSPCISWLSQNAQGWTEFIWRYIKMDLLGYIFPSRRKLIQFFCIQANFCQTEPVIATDAIDSDTLKFDNNARTILLKLSCAGWYLWFYFVVLLSQALAIDEKLPTFDFTRSCCQMFVSIILHTRHVIIWYDSSSNWVKPFVTVPEVALNFRRRCNLENIFTMYCWKYFSSIDNFHQYTAILKIFSLSIGNQLIIYSI